MEVDPGQAQTSGPEPEKIKSINVGPFESDYNTLLSVAGELSISRSMVVRSALQNFFQRHRAGEINLMAEGGTLQIQSAVLAPAKAPARKTSKKKKKKKQATSKKGKKRKKDLKPAKKKK